MQVGTVLMRVKRVSQRIIGSASVHPASYRVMMCVMCEYYPRKTKEKREKREGKRKKTATEEGDIDA